MCDRPIAMKILETMDKCPHCGAQFRHVAINAILNNTVLLADLQDLQQRCTEIHSENDQLRGVVTAMTASHESPYDP